MDVHELWTDNLRLRKRYFTISNKDGSHLKKINMNGLVWTVDYKRDFYMDYLSKQAAWKVIKANELNNCFPAEHFEFKSILEIIIGYLTFWINFPVPKYVIGDNRFKYGNYLINSLGNPDKQDYKINISEIFSNNIKAALNSKFVFNCREDANNYIKANDPYNYFDNYKAELVFVKGKYNIIERIVILGIFSIGIILFDPFFDYSFNMFISKVIEFVNSANFNLFNCFYIGYAIYFYIYLFLYMDKLIENKPY